jgi:hypothetical protein
MEVVEIVILACLLRQPEHCETFRIPFQREMSVAQCTWESEFHAVRWVDEHPDWELKRFSCELPGA